MFVLNFTLLLSGLWRSLDVVAKGRRRPFDDKSQDLMIPLRTLVGICVTSEFFCADDLRGGCVRSHQISVDASLFDLPVFKNDDPKGAEAFSAALTNKFHLNICFVWSKLP